MDADGYLMISGIQHFSFCRRQWALIHLEQQWAENLRTTEGHLLHQRCHDETFREKRGDLLVVRGLRVISHRLKMTGACDVVEFHADPEGIALEGFSGLWLPVPVEYKHGSPKSNDADRLQLCAQAMALEEMLVCAQVHGVPVFLSAFEKWSYILRVCLQVIYFPEWGIVVQTIHHEPEHDIFGNIVHCIRYF